MKRAKKSDMKNENTKMYETVKKIKHLGPPQKLLIKWKNGLTANPAEESKITAEYFKETFYEDNSQEQSYHRHEWRYHSQPIIYEKQPKWSQTKVLAVTKFRSSL